MHRLNLAKTKREEKRDNPPTSDIAAITALSEIEPLSVGCFNCVCPECGALHDKLETTTKGIYMNCYNNGNYKLYNTF